MLCVKPSNLTPKCLVPSMEHKHSQDGVGGGGEGGGFYLINWQNQL